MSDEPEIPLDVISKRELHGFDITALKKTDSTLHVLKQAEKRIIRNGEIPAASMATWEFLSIYAQSLFPEDVSKRLFGLWEKPQVAPIIENNNRPKIYYHGEQASAYSEISGYNTHLLTQLLDLEDIINPYFYQESFNHELRSIPVVDYYLVSDILEEIPELDPNGEIQTLIDEYWTEFDRLNADQTPRNDLLQARELRRIDLDGNGSNRYQTSLQLIETSHDLAHKFAELYRDLEASNSKQLWRNKPLIDVILLLTHHHQTTSQQMIMW